MAIWSRDKQFGAGVGGFNAADGADGSNNNSIVPTSTRFGLIFSNIVDATLSRSKTLSTALYRILQAGLHKDEDKATGSNIGVSGTGIESTQTVYTTPEQLPEVTKTTNDFSTPAKSDSNGALTTTNDLFNVSTVTTDRKNKRFVVNFSEAGVLFFKARTWLDSELVTKINGLIATAIAAIPARVTPLWTQVNISTPLTLTTSFVSVPTATYTTPTSTSIYKITAIAEIDGDGETGKISGATLRLYNTTDSLSYDERTIAISLPTGNDFTLNNTVSTIVSIGASKTIVLQAKLDVDHDATAPCQLINAKFLIEEIK